MQIKDNITKAQGYMKKYYDGKVGKKKFSTSLKVNDSVLKANKKRGAACSKWSGPYILENIKKLW